MTTSMVPLGFRKDGAEISFTCPFCGNVKGKFEVNTLKNLYHCFRCGASGTVEKLSTLLGLDCFSLPRPYEPPPKPASPGTLHSPLTPLSRLEGTEIYQTTMDYLSSRGVTREVALLLGLYVTPEYPLRVIVPLHNNPLDHEEMASFVARSIHPQVTPKEVSAPTRDGWEKKSNFLFFPPHAKEKISGASTLVLVEGVFDALAVERAGYLSAALLGSSISPRQAFTIGLMATEEIVIVPDGDPSGSRLVLACAKAIHDVLVAQPPPGWDPDELPTEELKSLICSAEPYSIWAARREALGRP